jgi:hypothetical protein
LSHAELVSASVGYLGTISKSRLPVKTAGVRRTHLHGLWTTDHFVWQSPRAMQHGFDCIFSLIRFF